MFARLPILCASAYLASAVVSVETARLPERFNLACSGILAAPADSATTSAILADGQVDLAGGNVRGFGLGGQTIYAVSATRIAFGSGNGDLGARLIEGSIDRETLETRILVRSAGSEEPPVMAMRLDCRAVPPRA